MRPSAGQLRPGWRLYVTLPRKERGALNYYMERHHCLLSTVSIRFCDLAMRLCVFVVSLCGFVFQLCVFDLSLCRFVMPLCVFTLSLCHFVLPLCVFVLSFCRFVLPLCCSIIPLSDTTVQFCQITIRLCDAQCDPAYSSFDSTILFGYVWHRFVRWFHHAIMWFRRSVLRSPATLMRPCGKLGLTFDTDRDVFSGDLFGG